MQSGVGVGTFPRIVFTILKEVVKASLGHIPQPFLISDIKNYDKDTNGNV
jgi:hypothetical protein